jgi:hypothetical protein
MLDIVEYQKRLRHLVNLSYVSKMQGRSESGEAKLVKDGILFVENSSLLVVEHSKTLLIEKEIHQIINLNELAEVSIFVLEKSHLLE